MGQGLQKRDLWALGLALIIAISTAIMARIFLLPSPVSSQGQKVMMTTSSKQPVIEEAYVLIASQDIELGASLSQSNVTWEKWPRQSVSSEYFAKDPRNEWLNATHKQLPIFGMVLNQPLSKGMPISPNYLSDAKQRGVASIVLGPGMRAVTVPIAQNLVAPDIIVPGDKVDVFAGEGDAKTPAVRIDNVHVLAIDSSLQKKKALENGSDPSKNPPPAAGAAVLPRTVTLEVYPEYVGPLLSAAREKGVILSLRSAHSANAETQGPVFVNTPQVHENQQSLPQLAGENMKPQIPASLADRLESAGHTVRIMRANQTEEIKFNAKGEAIGTGQSAGLPTTSIPAGFINPSIMSMPLTALNASKKSNTQPEQVNQRGLEVPENKKSLNLIRSEAFK